MTKLHVALDADGVVVDFVEGICTSLRKEYGADIRAEDITAYDLGPVLDPIIGHNWWDWMRDRDWLWALFPAVDGAIGAIDQLRREGHYLELVTAKPEWAEYAMWKWIGRWRPRVNRTTIVEVGANKADWTDADLLVDDHPTNCHQFVAAGGKALLFDTTYNRDAVMVGPMIRARGWSDVLTYVDLESEGLL